MFMDMRYFLKKFNIAAISILVTCSFFLNSIVYGRDLSENTGLRAPVLTNSPEGIVRTHEALMELVKLEELTPTRLRTALWCIESFIRYVKDTRLKKIEENNMLLARAIVGARYITTISEKRGNIEGGEGLLFAWNNSWHLLNCLASIGKTNVIEEQEWLSAEDRFETIKSGIEKWLKNKDTDTGSIVEKDIITDYDIQKIIEAAFTKNKEILKYFDAEDNKWEDIAKETAKEIGKLKKKFTFSELEKIHDKYRGEPEVSLFFWLVREDLEREYSAYAGSIKPLKVVLLFVNNERDTDKVNDALGIEILKGVLVKRFKQAVDVTLIHPQIDKTEESVIAEINRIKPDILGISQSFYAWDKVIKIVSAVREQKDRPVLVLGNVGAAFAFTKALKDVPEALVCTGEGEDTLSYIVSFVLGEDVRLKDIPNLAYYAGDEVQTTFPRSVEIKFTGIPSRDFVGETKRTLGMSLSEVSRGCKYNCSFCSRAAFLGKSNRVRKIKDVLQEIKGLSQAGISFVNFVDEDFSQIGLEKILEFAEELIKLRENGEISKDMRFSTSVTAKGVLVFDGYKKEGVSLLKKLYQSGFETFYVGIESGTKEQLFERYHKSVNKDINIKALEALRREGIFCIAGFITLDPKVSLKEVKENITFCRENGIDGSMVYAPKTLLIMLGTGLPELYKGQIVGQPNYKTLSYEYIYDSQDADKIADILYILKQWEESHTAVYWESKVLKRSGQYNGLNLETKEEILKTMLNLETLLMDYFEELVDTAIEGKAESQVKGIERKYSKKSIDIFLDILSRLGQKKNGMDTEKFKYLLHKGILREVIRVFLSDGTPFSLIDIMKVLSQEFPGKSINVSEETMRDILVDYVRENLLKEISASSYRLTEEFYYLRDLPYVDLPRPSKAQYEKIHNILDRDGLEEMDLRGIRKLRKSSNINTWI